MSIATISDGENGLSVRQKLNSCIGATNYISSSESPASDASFIDPVYGSDVSGNGSFSLPFLTAQKAYESGCTNLFIRPGNAGTINLSGNNTRFSIYGVGANDFFPSSSSSDAPFAQAPVLSPLTSVLLKNDDQTTNHIHVYSNNGVTISISGAASLALGVGIEAAFYNAIIGDATLKGLPSAANPDGNGDNGGPGGILYLGHSTVIGNISMNGGRGGDGGNGGNGGNGGDGGNIVSHYSRILGSVDLQGGENGLGDDPGVNGYYGSNGAVKSAYSMFTSAPTNTGTPSWRYSLVNGVARP